MEDFTYLTQDQLKSITAIVKSVDPSYLEPFIFTAEQMHLIPIIGDALDAQLQSEIEAGTISGANETLWNNYLIYLSAWYTFYEASPFINYKAFNKGILKQFSDSSQNVDLDELKYYRQSILDKANFYKLKLIDYLEDHKASYPLWRSENCDDNNQYYNRSSNSTGIFLG